MIGGSVIVLATSCVLSVIYLSCLLLPISLVAINSSDGDLFKIGILGLIYWLLMMNISRRAAEISKQAVRFKNEQVILRSQIENERNELARAYARLRDANNELDQANLTLEDKVAKRTAQIERLSKLDTLTGLLNRSAFITELNQSINTYPDKPLAVLFVDLNGFKAINDALGHRVGDEVLRTVSERLSKLAQEASVCRWVVTSLS